HQLAAEIFRRTNANLVEIGVIKRVPALRIRRERVANDAVGRHAFEHDLDALQRELHLDLINLAGSAVYELQLRAQRECEVCVFDAHRGGNGRLIRCADGAGWIVDDAVEPLLERRAAWERDVEELRAVAATGLRALA